MTDSPRFDEARSAAIRSALVETVAADAAATAAHPHARSRSRRLRIALVAVLAALGIGLGGTAVAFAITGTPLFPIAAPVATAEPTSTAPAPTASPTATSAPSAPAAHPLVVTDQPIAPHDVLTAPASSPTWSVQLPGAGDMCEHVSSIDVSDGFALLQSGPAYPPEDSNYTCDLDASRYSLTLIDTSTGEQLWSRDWSWAFTHGDGTSASLLGTSGRVLVWDRLNGPGPKEVLDLATGETLATVTAPAGFAVTDLYPVPGDSGDVSFVTQKLDAAGQPITSWAVMRADPQDLATPRWSVPYEADQSSTQPITNSSSMMQVTHRQGDGAEVLDVYDVDSGALMVGATTDRSYSYFDGFTLRASDMIEYEVSRTVAGIDDAGNETWSRSLESGYAVAPVSRIATLPGALGIRPASEVLLIGPGAQLELVDGVTGESRWVVDGSGCPAGGGLSGPAVTTFGWSVTADGLVVQSGDDGVACGFDAETGAAADVTGRLSMYFGAQGALGNYRLEGAMGTGGLYSTKGQAAPTYPLPQSGVGTAYDTVTGASLWSVPAYYDESWIFAGGYLVGVSEGRVFGIG
ncbi:hypothetical protein [Herbiconiux liukaitaii]|uniref:hypothetical protein n=1 Tax=Herbiconiux liukaitaii TaxID=3342799 RepID=UPI0035BB9526